METNDHIHCQESPTEYHQAIQEEFTTGEEVLDRRLSLLHLDHCPMALTNADAPPQPPVTYGNTTPLKRRSSTLTFSPPDAPAAAAGKSPYGALISRGYSVLKLPSGNGPASSPLQNGPPLCRCSYAPTNNNLGFPSEILNRGVPAPREDPARRSLFPMKAQPTPSFPSQPLARSASDPVTLSQFQNPVGPRNSQSPGQESPSSKRRKRMDRIQRMKQMKKWVDEIVHEHDKVLDDEKINDECEEAAYEEGKNEEGEGGNGGAEEDMVSAKRVGEFTQLNFKCPCGCGFKVLIIGQSCFYKLI